MMEYPAWRRRENIIDRLVLGWKCQDLENSGDFVVSKEYTSGRLPNVHTLLAEVFYLNLCKQGKCENVVVPNI